MPIRICASCNKFIKGDGVSRGGKYYHEKCLSMVCAYCHEFISGLRFRINGRYYHRECYIDHVEKVCVVCGKPIVHGRYYVDEWGNSAHVMHGSEKTKSCHSCGRLISGEAKEIGADAVLCGKCSPSSVVTSAQVEVFRSKVLALFKSFGIDGVPEDIPITLVKIDLMDGAEGRMRYIRSSTGEVSGFKIEIIHGLPEVQFMGVLAHEMLHSWLLLYGREVTEEECEGFCNLGCGYVYQKINTEHSRYLLKRMYVSEDRIYGEGYRLQKMRYEKLGWTGLLESLRRK